jgi:hypothetical protein
MLMNCFGVVTDYCLSYRHRNARLMQQCRCCPPKRVKGQLFNLSTGRSTPRVSFMIFPWPKSRTLKEVAELIRKVSALGLSFENCTCAWMDRRIRIVLGPEGFQKPSQRCCNWQYHCFSGFASHKPQLAA